MQTETETSIHDPLGLEQLRVQALAGMGWVLAEQLTEFIARNPGVPPDPFQMYDMLVVALDDAVLLGRGQYAHDSAGARAALMLLVSASNVSTKIFDAARPPLGEDRMLSTEDVAKILNMSRPYVAKLADSGKLGDVQRTEGGQRRISAAAAENYRKERQIQSRKSLDELAAISQDLGLYSTPGKSSPKEG